MLGFLTVLCGAKENNMSRTWVVVLLSFPSLLWPGMVAGQSPSARRDPEALGKLSRSLQALTGGKSVRDVSLSGTVRRIAGSDKETGQITAKAVAAGETRVDYDYASGSRSESRVVSSARVVESWSGADGITHTVVPHNVAPLSPWFFPDVLLQTWEQDSEITLEDVGKETRSGRDVDHLTLSKQVPALHHPSVMLTLLQKAAQVQLYLDAGTGFPLAIAYHTHPDKNLARDIPVEIRFSDYHSVDGVQAPYRVQKYLNHALVLDVQFQTATLNSGLSASTWGLQ